MWPRDHQRAAQALDRYLQGVRVSAIAASFHLSPSTVRRWINAQLSQIAREENTARVEQLQAAIETQRATAREAWAAYYREQARAELLTRDQPPSARQPYIHAHTYLRLALIAQREVARLQGLYTHTEAPAGQFTVVVKQHLPGPENIPPSQPLSAASAAVSQTAQTAQTAHTPRPPTAGRRTPRLTRRARNKLQLARIHRSRSAARAGPDPPRSI